MVLMRLVMAVNVALGGGKMMLLKGTKLSLEEVCCCLEAHLMLDYGLVEESQSEY